MQVVLCPRLLQGSGFEAYARARGLSPEVAGKLANILGVMGAWDGIVANGKDIFK